MTTLQMLTLRRNTSLSRLAALERRAERLGAAAAPLVRSAIEELTTALEEVQVATEQLQAHVDDLGTARAELDQLRTDWDEFTELVPVACLWTNAAGEIEHANSAAATLLNVSAPRLVGRPLLLFLTERHKFEEALLALDEGLTRAVALDVVIRPRERKPREVHVAGRRLRNQNRRCWFLAVREPAR